MDDRIIKIAENYGLELQLVKAQEELAELMCSIARHLLQRSYKHIEDGYLPVAVLEEVADTEIMINQIKYLSKSEHKVKEIVEAKLKRQIERIE